MACKKELALMLIKVGGLRKGCILMLIACALCSACVQSRSRVVIGGNKCVKVFGAKLPGLNGGSRNNDHRVSLVVSDVALANDVYNVFSLLARNGAWEHVRLMLNDNDGIGIYYGTREDYKPLIEYPNNIGVQFKLKNGRKSLIVCRGASEREYLESNVRWLYDEFGRMGESWSMEVCCNRDYPFRDIIKIGRIAANNGCRLLYFTVRPD